MIVLKNISKIFGEKRVIDDVSLSINSGEVVAVIGPSGGGKSTFLRCINFLTPPDSGIVEIGSKKVTNKNLKKVRANIGMVFQSFNLFPHMNVLDNIIYPQVKTLNKSRKSAEQVSLDLLKKVGLSGYEKKYPISLSGGQKQRVAIARSLAMKPSIMLFDEPTSALDPEMVREVLDIIRDLAKTKITMIIVTHEIGFAKELADRVLFFDAGRVIEDLPKKQFFTNSKSDRVNWFLSKVL
ncbi:MAG: amino acid ABC transporter ATP-binding protein [Alphaproteobacteria bacterium]|nr:amino acid ABC transporter ATP-binding protein [Alphaproteobacteria bacterium]